MRRVILFALLLSWTLAAMAADPRAVIHLLDYLSVDYPGTVEDGRVTNPAEYAEQSEFADKLVNDMATLPDHPAKTRLLEEARRLRAAIQAKAPGEQVSTQARTLERELAKVYQVSTTPRRPPDLTQASPLYQRHCAACHGPEGFGDGPQGSELDPPPIDFHDRERAFQRSLYGLYSAITHGVDGTAMRAFDELTPEQRWALAFHEGRWAFTPTEVAEGKRLWEAGDRRMDFTDLVTLTPAEIQARWGDEGIALTAYLRHHPEVLMDTRSTLQQARTLLAESLHLYERGDRENAYRTAVAAYLEGFELVEPGLRAVQPERVTRIETLMLLYRQKVKEGTPLSELEQLVSEIDALLQEAERHSAQHRLTGTAGLVSALVIILREGLEAILVLAAIGGILVQGGRRDALPYLHAGWTSALVAGGLTWLAAGSLIDLSGAGRELTEGLTALIAAVVLLYVGFWLHGKSHAQRWKEYVRERIHSALHGRTLWLLTGVAFLAVYREVFETVLFFQALLLQAGDQSRHMIWLGLLVGSAILALLALLILRVGRRLPLRQFFIVNAWIMLALAVSFIGHGLAALQEAGWLGIHPLPLPRWDLIGLYPTMETVGTQLAVLAFIVWMYRRQDREEASSG